MNKFTSYIFGDNAAKLKELVDSNGRSWFLGASIEDALGSTNPRNGTYSRVNRLVDYIEQQHKVEPLFKEGERLTFPGNELYGRVVASDDVNAVAAVCRNESMIGRNAFYFNENSLIWCVTHSTSPIRDHLMLLVSTEIMPITTDYDEYVFLDADGFSYVLRERLDDGIKKGTFDDSIFDKVLEAAYFIRFGLNSEELCAKFGVDSIRALRGKIDNDDKYYLAAIEQCFASALLFGMDFDEVLKSDNLIELYRRSPKV